MVIPREGEKRKVFARDSIVLVTAASRSHYLLNTVSSRGVDILTDTSFLSIIKSRCNYSI